LLERCADDELRIAAMRRMLGEASRSGALWLNRIEESFYHRCGRLRPDTDLLHEVRLRAESRIHLLEEDARLRVQVERETASAPPSRLIAPANATDTCSAC
jgi:hypothetical protein